MLILALESSAKAASVALCRDGVLIAQSQQCSGLTQRGFDEAGVLGRRGFPAHDRPGVGVDDERDVDEHAGDELDVGEVGHEQHVGCGHPELAVHQVRRSHRLRVAMTV